MSVTASKMAGDEPQPRSYAFSSSLVALAREPSGTAESIRALRTHVMAQHVQEGRRALAVCAATPGVGCTFVASNLAVALSQIGVKTLLIDVNMRQPGVDRLFQPAHQVLGLQQCLMASDANFGDYIDEEIIPDLSIMYAGGVAPNPQELLATDRFAEFMNFCLRDYDMTIIDTPPANSCSDVHRVSTVVGYAMIVTRRDKTRVSDLKTLVSELREDRARVVGTVMTEV
jgi:protein-tyrosine kinase